MGCPGREARPDPALLLHLTPSVRAVLSSVLLGVILAAPAATQTGSVVVNGSFENGTLSGWTAEGDLTASTAAAWEGQFSARMNGTGRLRQTLVVQAGQLYHVSARLRLDQEIVPPTWGGLALVVYGAGWVRLAGQDGLSAASLGLGLWKRLDFTFVAPGPSVVIEFDNFSGGGRFDASLDAVIVSPEAMAPDPGDTTPPVVIIASPGNGVTTSHPSIGLSGSASDAGGIVRVRWFNERGGEGAALGLASWTAAVPVASGLNRIGVEAEDAAGNVGRAVVEVHGTMPAAAPAPAVDRPELVAGPARRWNRVELRSHVVTASTRPYYPYSPVDDGYGHPTGITVDALVEQPDGQTVVIPAFHHVPYRHVAMANADVLGITGPADWRVRLTPSQPGVYRVRLRVVDAGGLVESAALDVDVGDGPGRGFVRVSTDDPRVLVFDDGSPLVPVSEGRQWAPAGHRPISSYDEAFAADAASGISLTRVWDQNDGFDIALEGSYPVWSPKWSQFSQALGIDLVTVRSGRRAARFQPRGAGRATDGYVQRIAVEPNQTYVAEGYIRTNGLDGAAVLAVAVGDGAVPGAVRSPARSGTAPWQLVSVSFTTGPDDHVATLWAGAIDSLGTAWFDDLVVRVQGDDLNRLSDPGFERHFPKDDEGNDPEDPAVNLTVPQGTEINQWGAHAIDEILGAADRHGLAVQLCSHEDVYWTWDATVHRDDYAVANGRQVEWLDARHLGYWKRNYRYRVARWSAFTSLLAWEVWNEHGEIPTSGTAEQVALSQFYGELARFIRRLDPARHLVTTSQGSQTFSTAFWASSPLDLANYHDYITTALVRHPSALNDDGAKFVYDLAAGLVAGWPEGAPRKPLVWGEIGTLTTWDHDDPTATTPPGGTIARHNFAWAGLFSPVLTGPIDFQTVAKSESTKAIRQFFAEEPWATAVWENWATPDVGGGSVPALEVLHPRLRVLGLLSQSRRRFLAWLQHLDHTWARVVRDGQTPAPFVPTARTPALEPGRYRIEWWDTRAGATTSSSEVNHPGGPLTLTGPALASDVALKVISLDEPPRPAAPRGLRVVPQP